MNHYQAYIRSPKWRIKSRTAIKLWGGRCALFPFLKANHTHHLSYVNLTNEWYFFDIIPVNEWIHFKICHSRIFWKKRKKHSKRRWIGANLFRIIALTNIILRVLIWLITTIIISIFNLIIHKKSTNNKKIKIKVKRLTSKK